MTTISNMIVLNLQLGLTSTKKTNIWTQAGVRALEGNISEILVFNTNLSAADRQNANAYLSTSGD